jgi:hypothetical protein
MSEACYCDGAPPIFYHATNVERAREPHKCYDCGGPILPGESYEKVRAMWDRGCPQTIHTCAWCVDLRAWMTAHVPCFCYLHGGLFEMIGEELDNLPHDDAEAIRPEIEAMWSPHRGEPSGVGMQK